MLYTVEPLIGHTPRWIARAMGYERLRVLRGQFGCKFQFGSGQNLWGMGGYGLREVCVMRVSTVFISLPTKHLPVPAVPSMHIADNVAFRL